MKQKWTVEFEWDDESDSLESDQNWVLDLDDKGIAFWCFHSPSYVLEWKVIKKE